MYIEKLISEKLNIKIDSLKRTYGGMMNHSYLVNNEFFFYIPVDQNSRLVDRKLEKEVSALFFENGLTSEMVYFDVLTGIKGKKYIQGQSLNNIEKCDYTKVSKLFKKLHDSKMSCGRDYNPIPKLISYYQDCTKLGINLDSSFSFLYNLILENRDFLEHCSKILCHNDAQKSNIIAASDNNYYFIDFEFAMDNDPIYDYACFGNNDVEDGYKVLLESFPNCSESIKKRFYLWRIFISLQWYLVALIKDCNNEGEKLNTNFKEVAIHFINNAHYAYNKLINL